MRVQVDKEKDKNETPMTPVVRCGERDGSSWTLARPHLVPSLSKLHIPYIHVPNTKFLPSTRYFLLHHKCSDGHFVHSHHIAKKLRFNRYDLNEPRYSKNLELFLFVPEVHVLR